MAGKIVLAVVAFGGHNTIAYSNRLSKYSVSRRILEKKWRKKISPDFPHTTCARNWIMRANLSHNVLWHFLENWPDVVPQPSNRNSGYAQVGFEPRPRDPVMKTEPLGHPTTDIVWLLVAVTSIFLIRVEANCCVAYLVPRYIVKGTFLPSSYWLSSSWIPNV